MAKGGQHKLGWLRKLWPSLWKKLTNDTYCYACGEEYKTPKDKQYCEYCKRYFCRAHISPKAHDAECYAAWKDATNQTYCYKCEKEYDGPSDKKECEYCGRYFCGAHVAPTSHGMGCKIKSNGTLCWRCERPYKSWTEAHKCGYCGRIFCSDHWLPENHQCGGNPTRPHGGLRETHSASGGITASGK